jgi:hypothetical protein
MAIGVPTINVCFVGTLEDEPPASLDALIVSCAGDATGDHALLHPLADRFPVFLVVDDPAPARAGDDLYAAVVPIRDPMALLNAIRNHLQLPHDPVGPFIFCICGRRLPVLQASFDVKGHHASVHCDKCGWATAIEPLDRKVRSSGV